jgi:hypothetical protein
MKRTEAILVGCLAISLAGCALRGAPKTANAIPPVPKPAVAPPPAPPQPLSIPQTNVALPEPQPLEPAALETSPPEPPPETAAPRPKPNSNRATLPTPPKPEAGPPQAEPEPRPAIQAIVPAAEQKRLHDSLERRRTEVNQILKQASSHRQTPLQRSVVRMIGSFMELAAEAEKQGDLKQADGSAERAQILAKELQGGK